MAVRVALGARRAGLVRGVLVESLVLGLAGGACGLIVAYWATALVASLDAAVAIPLLDQTRLDWNVALFTLGIRWARRWCSGWCRRGRPRRWAT